MISTGTITQVGPNKSVPQTSDDRILFGPNSISELSHVFDVSPEKPTTIIAFNLGEQDRLYLTHVGFVDSNYSQRAVRGGLPIILSSQDTGIYLANRGRYRLEYVGDSPLGSFYVEIVR